MNDLRKTTITTLEVAEMMEVPHSDLLKKIEGRKDRRGYIQIMTEGQMSVSDFFIPSSYRDASGKENKCYEVTRLGCDFLANKSTGEKGVLFTARYVKRFNEMEKERENPNPAEIPIGEVASYLKAIDRAAVRQNTPPYKIMEAFMMVSEQFGIRLPDDFVKVPEYEQMTLDTVMS
ncbi:MAG: toxin Bro [Lachnospiraceae bacterium]|nr:toxin Bro [Lachnospiraceae bacterium]